MSRRERACIARGRASRRDHVGHRNPPRWMGGGMRDYEAIEARTYGAAIFERGNLDEL